MTILCLQEVENRVIQVMSTLNNKAAEQLSLLPPASGSYLTLVIAVER